MKYRIIENKDGFNVEKFYEPVQEGKSNWFLKLLFGNEISGWHLLARNGDRYFLVDALEFGYDEPSPKAVFKTEEKAKRFLKRISTEERVICEV